MKNDYISKWKLFITSYLPLYLWILLSSINYSEILKINWFDIKLIYKLINFRNIFRLVIIMLIIISIREIRQLLIGSGSERKSLPQDMEISPESDSLMNYVVTYFTPLISFDLNDHKSVIMNILLFLLIGLMYVGSSATYLNPVLGIWGFKIFGVSGFPNAHHIISKLSFDEIETAKKRGDEVIRYRLGDGIYVIKPIISSER